MSAAALRHHSANATTSRLAAWLAGAGMPDRSDRIAERRNFVHVKRCFMAAVARIEGRRGQWLRHQVRQTHEPVDLWLLRGAVFDAITARGPVAAQDLRFELQRALDGLMPSCDEGDAPPTEF